jgi:hypothetical protein
VRRDRWLLWCWAYAVSTAAACRWLVMRMRSRSSRRTEPTKRSAIALARGARTGACDADVGGGEDGVERGAELGVAVPDEEPESSAGVLEVHEQVAGLLGQPGAGGKRGARCEETLIPQSG